mgnify:CR=1 FL=1
MVGRDPHERHRVATPLELLFDLTFVVAFGIAAAEFAHALAADQVGAGFAAFAQRVKAAAQSLCGGRLVLVLEGGYNLTALGDSVVATIRALDAD